MKKKRTTPVRHETVTDDASLIGNMVNESQPERCVTEGFLTDEHKEIAYYGSLAGFNTIQQAQHYSQKLLAQNMPVRTIERTSKTLSGEKRVWYQIVTQPHTQKAELVALLARAKHLCPEMNEGKDLVIIEINNEQKQMLFGKKGS